MVVADSASLGPLEVAGSPEEKFREFLEIRGEKLTEPRRILVRHIYDSHKHFDADELVADLHNAGRRVSRSTVYRTLRLLVEAGRKAGHTFSQPDLIIAATALHHDLTVVSRDTTDFDILPGLKAEDSLIHASFR